MRNIRNLSNEAIKSLEEIVKNDSRYRSRHRAKAILLSNQGKSVNELIDIFGCSKRTIYRWFDRFSHYASIELLHDLPGRGRKAVLDVEKDEKIVKEIIKDKINIYEICVELEKRLNNDFQEVMKIKWSTKKPNLTLIDYSQMKRFTFKIDIKITKRILKRFFKKIGVSYKRARRSIFKESKWKDYWQKKAQIKTVKNYVDEGLCNLYYFDESGFSMNSNIPYVWSEIGNPLEVPSDRWGKRLNVLGFLNTKNKDLFFETVEGKVDSQIVINLFDKFANHIEKNTVVILDNASIHRSKLFKSNIKKWEKQGLFLLYLPPYSPELNLIEILWREMKYQWMDTKAYLSLENISKHVVYMLENFGEKYDINFV
jgi:transposase